MSRHRNIRRGQFLEEEDDYGDVYGHSMEDNYCISPSTAAQFTYDRDRGSRQFGEYFGDIPEEDVEEQFDEVQQPVTSCVEHLSPADKNKLSQCLDYIRSVAGVEHSDEELSQVAIAANFDANAALDLLFADNSSASTRAKDIPSAKPKPSSSRQESRPSARPTKSTEVRAEASVSGEQTRRVAQLAISETKPRSRSSTPKRGGDEKSDSTKLDTPATPVRTERKRKELEEIKKEFARRELEKPLLNLVVIGHVDAGKSTLMGHLLYSLGQVSQRQMHKYQTEAGKLGKASFAYAWVLDETEEERARGVTMDVAQTRFETDHRIINLLDAPGHKDFIPNMITGAAQADCAVLVINATRGEFESGFDQGGQTMEHAMLARSLGVGQLIVAVNKMDTVGWSEERYRHIVDKLSTFLMKTAQFKDGDVRFVPVSGLGGENLLASSPLPDSASWYTANSTLVDMIDTLRAPERNIDSALRLCITDVFRGPTGGGCCVAGKVETGVLCQSDRVIIQPSGETAVVKAVTVDGSSSQIGFAGDQLTVTLSGVEPSAAGPGSVLCDQPVPTATRFKARIVLLDVPRPVIKGTAVVLHIQSLTEPATISKLLVLHNKGKQTLKPKLLQKHNQATVVIDLSRSICLETYKECRALGRFMLRSEGRTLAAGMVEQILPTKISKPKAAD